MAGPGLRISIDNEGPIFRNDATGKIRKAVEDTVEETVNFAESTLHTMATMRPRGVFLSPAQAGRRASTGNYRRNIHGRRTGLHGRVDDNKVVYGPWLEGTSTRNQTTRFKGYALWRRTQQMIEKRVPDILKRKVGRAIKELGG